MTIPVSDPMVEEDVVRDLPCTREEEARITKELQEEGKANLEEGTFYFLVSIRWYNSWQRYLACDVEAKDPSDVSRPGSIDNRDILEKGTRQLRKGLEEWTDYAPIPRNLWIQLWKWYKGGPPIPRKMIRNYTVEVYLFCLTLIDSRDNSSTIIRLSGRDSLRKLYTVACKAIGLIKQKVHIWDYLDKKKRELLSPSPITRLEDSELLKEQDILIEPSGSESSQYGVSLPGNELRKEIVQPTSAFGKGLAGLVNLGNTCFMNSILQCLAHTQPFVEYFLNADINAENPMGELANAFAVVLRKLWESKGAVVPYGFKIKFVRFAPQFSGNDPQDSHEFLFLLLDGLHKDLNKVKQKPDIKATSSDGRPDNEVAEEFWKDHKARNDSVIVDVCNGYYKLTHFCADCGTKSIAFEPFLDLSLPIPSVLSLSMTVAVFYADRNNLWKPYTVTVPADGTRRDLSNALGNACCLNNNESLLLAEVYDHKVLKFWDPLESVSLSRLKENDRIVAYRVQKGPGKVLLEILHAEQIKSEYDSGQYPELFGTPLVTYIDNEPLSGSDINTIISRLLSPLRRVLDDPVEKLAGFSVRDIQKDETIADDIELSFKIFSTEYDCLNVTPLESGSVVNPDKATRIVVSWEEKEQEKYDSSYMNDLPKVGLVMNTARQDEVSLFSCLEKFIAEEPLEKMWNCPDCKELRQAYTKKDLWKLPDVLIFNLLRATFSLRSSFKIDSYVDYPIYDLDLTDYVKNKDGETYEYELYAVSNHYGGMEGGHYTAYAALYENSKWYCFDDRNVSEVADESKITSAAAYVLFYRRIIRSESPEAPEVELDISQDS